MRVPLLDLRPQYESVREEIDAAVARVVEGQRFILGPQVEELERELARLVDVEHAIGCASGTDALLLALRALQLEPGDEVVVPAFTFFATAGAVWNAGLRPAFADVDAATFNLTAETLRAALTERTRAVIVVHLFGQMADMAPLLAVARERGLHVIEDAAQSLGARQRLDDVWRQAGALGDAGCFSFFPSKNLGAFGDAGLVTAQDAGVAERVRKLRVHGGRQMYHHEMVGTNSRLDTLQAAVLLAKLPHLGEWTEARRAHARYYDERFAGSGAVTAPTTLPQNEHVYNQYTVRTSQRDELRRFLDERGIGTGIYYPVPLHLQECFAELGYAAGDLPVAEGLAADVLSLPVYPELSAEQLEYVADGVLEFAG